MPIRPTYFSSSFVHDQIKMHLHETVDKNSLVRKLSDDWNSLKDVKPENRIRWSVIDGSMTKTGEPIVVLFNKNTGFGRYMHFYFYGQSLFIPFSVMKICGGLKAVMRSVFRGAGDRIVEDLKAAGRWAPLSDIEKLRFVQGLSLSNAITERDIETLKDLETDKNWLGKE